MNQKATKVYFFQLTRQCRLAHEVLILVGTSLIFGSYFFAPRVKNE